MAKASLLCCLLMVAAPVRLTAQNNGSVRKNSPVTLKYLGTAGWEISDGTTIILIDPYLSRINGPARPGEDRATPSPEIRAGRTDGMMLPLLM
jgi:hypothetical protein